MSRRVFGGGPDWPGSSESTAAERGPPAAAAAASQLPTTEAGPARGATGPGPKGGRRHIRWHRPTVPVTQSDSRLGFNLPGRGLRLAVRVTGTSESLLNLTRRSETLSPPAFSSWRTCQWAIRFAFKLARRPRANIDRILLGFPQLAAPLPGLARGYPAPGFFWVSLNWQLRCRDWHEARVSGGPSLTTGPLIEWLREVGKVEVYYEQYHP